MTKTASVLPVATVIMMQAAGGTAQHSMLMMMTTMTVTSHRLSRRATPAALALAARSECAAFLSHLLRMMMAGAVQPRKSIRVLLPVATATTAPQAMAPVRGVR